MTYRCKEYKTLHNELRAEYDQEVHRRIFEDIIQDRGHLGPSQASRLTAGPNYDQECQEICERLFFVFVFRNRERMAGQELRFVETGEEWRRGFDLP